MPAGTSFSGRLLPDRILKGAVSAAKNEGLYHSYEANVLASRATTQHSQYLLIAELTPPPLSEFISRRSSGL